MKKIKLLAFIIACVLSFGALISCGNTGTNTDNPNDEKDQREVIYNLAVESGYTGTYEEWLESIKGDYIELSVTDTHIVWKYASDAVWRELIELSKLSSAGSTGEAGADGKDGVDGKTPEFRVNEGYLEWKYTTDTEWTKLYEVITNDSTEAPKEEVEYVNVTYCFENYDIEPVTIQVEKGSLLEVPYDVIPSGYKIHTVMFYDPVQYYQHWLFDVYTVNKDMTFKVELLKEYNVTYLDFDGNVYTNSTINEWEQLWLIEEINGTFVYWYYDKELTQKVNNGEHLFEDVTLYPAERINLDYFVRGSFNNWECQEEYKLIYSPENNTAFIQLYLEAGCEFKIADENWENIYDIYNINGNDCFGGEGNIYPLYSGLYRIEIYDIGTKNEKCYIHPLQREFIVTFESLGGTEFDPIKVYENDILVIEQIPTKEGYVFGGWYYDEGFTNPVGKHLWAYDNTVLYAYWKQGLFYSGTYEGEAVYNEELGVYTFDITLNLWGRFSLQYNDSKIETNDPNLTITGAYNSSNSADWTENLYNDAYDENGYIDYSTFICCYSGGATYTVTYDPINNILDFIFHEEVKDIPQDGLYYELYDNNRVCIESGLANIDENGNYKFNIIMKIWYRFNAYYNGNQISCYNANVTGDFGSYNGTKKDLFVDIENDSEYDFLCDYSSTDGVLYEISYNPTTNTLDIQDDEYEIEVTIPTDGLFYEYTETNGNYEVEIKYADPNNIINNEDGTISFNLTLGAWRYVAIYYNGEYIRFDDTVVCEGFTVGNGLYHHDDATLDYQFWNNVVNNTYNFTYDPSTKILTITLVA